jgi:prepilin-type processing-associated H-X9-DG protein
VAGAPAGFKYADGTMAPRVRSVSMNFFLGGFGGDPTAQLQGASGWPQYYPWYYKFTDIGSLGSAPGVATTFVFIDERPDCINWGNYAQDMTGYPVKAGNKPAAAQYQFTEDMPASFHGGSCGLSFADGHSEIHKWRDAVVTQPAAPNGQSLNSPRTGVPGQGTVFPDPFGKDVPWMQDKSARPH